jgi:peptidoglycan/LPS O-acetylase OafA/YrhL
VVGATAIATRLVAPATLWADTARQAIASTLYVQNWELANSAVDYLAEDNAASPLQHYWSLSIEEQFYLVWPLLVGLCAWWARRRGHRGRGLVLGAVAAVFAGSLAFSIWYTGVEPSAAYFVTPTRMWELALGGVVASIPAASQLGLPGSLRSGLAWLGVTAVVVSGFTFSAETPFPSYTALLPVAGVALVIWAGTDAKHSPTTLLRWRPIQWVGDASYSVYLWHWPLVVLLPYVSGGPLGIIDQTVIVVATLTLAGLTKVHVEDRFRHGRRGAPLWHSYRIAVAGMALLVAAGAAQLAEVSSITSAAEQQLASATTRADDCLGAAALARGPEVCPPDPAAELLPAPAFAKTDKSNAYPDKCWSNEPFTTRPTCTYGNGPTKVALVGNSHAGHWLPALEVLAKQLGWTTTTFLVSRCSASDARLVFHTEEKSKTCHDWGQWAKEQTRGKKYDLVITSERQSVPVVGHTLDNTGPAAVAGHTSFLKDWAKGRTNILVFKDPTFPGRTIRNIPDCLAEHLGEPAACSVPRGKWIVDDPLVTAARELNLSDVEVASFDDLVCAPTRCHGVNGSVVTYFDASHLTATYAKTMAPYMLALISTALKH